MIRSSWFVEWVFREVPFRMVGRGLVGGGVRVRPYDLRWGVGDPDDRILWAERVIEPSNRVTRDDLVAVVTGDLEGRFPAVTAGRGQPLHRDPDIGVDKPQFGPDHGGGERGGHGQCAVAEHLNVTLFGCRRLFR